MFDNFFTSASSSANLVSFLNTPCSSSTDIQRRIRHKGITYSCWKYVSAENDTNKTVKYVNFINNILTNNKNKSRGD